MNKNLLYGLLLACAGSMLTSGTNAQVNEHKIRMTNQKVAIAPMTVRLKADRMNADVVSTRNIGNGMKMQVCKDAQGRMFKRITGNVAENKRVDAMRKAVSRETGNTLSESFEDFDGESKTWLPEGWTRQSTEGLEYYQSWFIATKTEYAPAPADGNCYAEIIFSSNEQDEWLITPEVIVPENGVFSFYSFFQPPFLFDLSNDYVDWDNMVFIEKHKSATLQILISVDGGEWTLMKDVFDDYKDMSLTDLLYSIPEAMTKMTFKLDDYTGHSVRFAFRYWGKDGDSMFIDNVKVGLPELEASYMNPNGTLFWGFNKEFGIMPYSLLMEPVYTPLTWTNTTYNDAATYSWLYDDPDTRTSVTVESNDLTMTYKPDYTSESTTRNNLYNTPELTASAPGAGDGTFRKYDFFQAGGRSEFMFEREGENGEEEKELVTFGLATCDLLTEGMTIMTVEAEDPMEASLPIFGHNEKTTEWWTNHYFQGEQTETDKVEVNGIINFFNAPQSPMVIQGLWLNAKGQISEKSEFTAAIYPLDDAFVPAETPVATAKCNGKDVLVQEGGMQNYLTLPFAFESPVVVSDKDFSFYIVEISGFNSDEVTYFAPLQSAYPNPDYMCYGWLDVNITNNGVERNTMIPVANFESEFGECYNSFFINLDATYPWLQGKEDKFEAGTEGGSKTFTPDSYYDASELTLTANTADGKVPSWLTVSKDGRYGDTKITFTVAPGTEACSCDVTVSAPGVSKTYQINRAGTTGIETVNAVSANSKIIGIYNISGQMVGENDKSGNVKIVKYADGTVRKIAK